MIIVFFQSEENSPDSIFKYLKVVIIRILVNVLKVGNVVHLVLLNYHGLYVENPATLPYGRACCMLQHFQWKI